jgi:hypothetical protein
MVYNDFWQFQHLITEIFHSVLYLWPQAKRQTKDKIYINSCVALYGCDSGSLTLTRAWRVGV